MKFAYTYTTAILLKLLSPLLSESECYWCQSCAFQCVWVMSEVETVERRRYIYPYRQAPAAILTNKGGFTPRNHA